MDLAQLARQALLQILEELLDAGNADARQVAETHLLHVEHEYQTGVRSQFVQTRVDGHEERFDRLVEMVVGRLRVGQPMENDGHSVGAGRYVEVVSVWDRLALQM